MTDIISQYDGSNLTEIAEWLLDNTNEGQYPHQQCLDNIIHYFLQLQEQAVSK